MTACFIRMLFSTILGIRFFGLKDNLEGWGETDHHRLDQTDGALVLSDPVARSRLIELLGNQFKATEPSGHWRGLVCV